MEFVRLTVEDWQKAIKKVESAVVVLRKTVPRAFDTDSDSVTSATGFVVDKRRGFILTNRHVVQPGPVVADAIFLNNEEVPVHPIYRDPVHDFGFFRYDPSAIKFLDCAETPLAPDAARVGLEIIVVANNGSDKVSILPGTIDRLDCAAPQYTKDGYNDFNTFYIQATAGTKVGSSGSPVIDWQGRAVALHAGGDTSKTMAYFLPLERVVRALGFLQNGSETYVDRWIPVSIPRGTLQMTFLHKGFDETRRLHLTWETELTVRHASHVNETGMLVVESVVPGGPVHKYLEPGDILVRVNGQVITRFLQLETILDDSVNSNIELQIERGGSSKSLTILVQDLHSITPNYFLEVSGAVIHPLSYQQARNFQFPCGLVYVTKPGYMLFKAGVPCHAIITKFAGEEISCVSELISALSKVSRGARVPLEYISYIDRHRRKSVLVTLDRHEWCEPPQIYTRDDSTGLWIAKPAFQPYSSFLPSGYKDVGNLASRPSSSGVNESGRLVKKRRVDDLSTDGSVADISLNEPEETKLVQDDRLMDYQGATAATTNASVLERVIESTLVMLEVHVPPSCMLDGVHSEHCFGTGVIIYHTKDMGLVAVDKNTVAISLSDVLLSFAASSVEIPGEVVFLHPVHNFALISYDPSSLGPVVCASLVHAAELLPDPALRRGDSVYLVGLSRSLQATSKKSVVTNASAVLNIEFADSRRYTATNMEVIELETDFGSSFSGVLTDEQGRVQALWGSFSTQLICSGNTVMRGIPIYAISQVLDKIISGVNGTARIINGVKRHMPLLRILEVELYPTLLSKARSFGLSDAWIQEFVKKDPTRRQVLCVKGCLAQSKAENILEQEDMVLAINKEPVTCFRDIENACQALDKSNTNDGKLQMTIWRQEREIELLVRTDVRDGNGTTRAVSWCGCTIQDTHLVARVLGFLPEERRGVYVARCNDGCPAPRYGLFAFNLIVEVNGKPTPDLDTFVDVTKELEHEEVVQVKTIQLDGNPQVLSVKQDLHYWPTWELRFNQDTSRWLRTVIKVRKKLQ